MAIISKNLLKNTFSPSASLFSEYSEFDFFDLFSFTFQSFLPAFFLWPQSWDPIFCQKRKDLLSTKIEFFTTFGFYRLEHFSPPHLIIPWNNLNSNSQNSIPFKKLNVYEMRLFEAKNDYTKTWYECVVQKNLHLLV